MELHREDRWVADRLASIEPGWTPDTRRAHAVLLGSLTGRRPRRRLLAAIALVAASVAVAMLPEVRTLAQAAWTRFVVNGVGIVPFDLSQLPLQLHVTTDGTVEQVADLAQAAAKAGFMPRLPAAGLLPDTPRLVVTGPMVISQTVHVSELVAALTRAGARDVEIPASWEGAVLRADIGPMVGANYSDGTEILQVQPITLSVPAGFALDRFGEAAFRSIGVPAPMARTMGREFAAHPVWLLDTSDDTRVTVQEIGLRTGLGLLVEDLDDRGRVARATIVRGTADRLYAVESHSRALTFAVADALP